MNRTATAIWTGSLKDGKGAISTESGVLSKTPYSFKTRFESEKGTNPEELIAAAHAGCFTMALSAQLATMQLTPEHLETKAAVTLEKVGDAWTVTKVHLDLSGRVPGATQASFESAAASAKANCPISRLLKAEITLTVRFEGTAQSRSAT
jgi:lipoyl-dependent peroxiredoxin